MAGPRETKSSGEGSPFIPPCQWNLVQFGLLCSYTMGISAIWKFPYLVYKHTGLFLVAYYILQVLVCVPVTLLQLKLGMALRRGLMVICSHHLPALKGVGACLLCISFLVCVYHNVYLAQGICYMVLAISKQPYVWSVSRNTTITAESTHLFYGMNVAEEYYIKDFLQRSGSLSDPGWVPWYLGLSLLFIWIVTFAMVCRGAYWLGRIVYVTAPLAIVLLCTLLVYSHTAIPTAYLSLAQFFSSEGKTSSSSGSRSTGSSILSSELASPLTWTRALEQHVYCIGLWSGLMPMMGVHLPNKKPVSNVSWLFVLLVHSVLPHLGTIAVAPFIHALGFNNHQSFEEIIEMTHSRPHLVFVVLPEAFAVLNISPFWAFLFFLYFLMFAIHQQALLLVMLMENLAEQCEVWVKAVFRRHELMAAAFCILAFLLGLPHITQGGYYLTELLDQYLFRAIFIPVVLVVAPIVIAYLRLEALHMPIEKICLCIWFGLASLATAALWVYHQAVFASTRRVKWEAGLGWCIGLGPLFICLPLGVAHALYRAKGSFIERMSAIFQADPRGITASEPEPEIEYPEIEDWNGTLPQRKKKRALQNELMVTMASKQSNGDIATL